MTTTTDLSPDYAQTLSRLVDLQAKIADYSSEAESLKAELRNLEPGDYTLDGREALRIIPTRRFDAASAALRLPEDIRTKCLKVDYDAAEVRKHLTPVEVEEFMVASGKPKVTLL